MLSNGKHNCSLHLQMIGYNKMIIFMPTVELEKLRGAVKLFLTIIGELIYFFLWNTTKKT